MFSKIAFFAILVTTAHSSGGYSSFSYGVSDPNTGDIKDQQENRVGGNVVGKYSLLESDGTKRVVEYMADDATGFTAVVHKEPHVFGAAAVGGASTGPLAHRTSLAGAAALAHGPLSSTGHTTPFAAASAFSHPHLPATSHLTYGNAAELFGHGGINVGPSTLGSGPGYAGNGKPTVSSYSHSIVHNGPDAYPYGSAHGRYGVNGYGASLAGAASAQANPWTFNAGLAHGTGSTSANLWAPGAVHAVGSSSTVASGYHGGYATGLGHGNRLGW